MKQSEEIKENWRATENLRNFWRLSPKCYFWKAGWELGSVSIQFRDFENMFWYPKILSLKSFGNSWSNSYTRGELNQY